MVGFATLETGLVVRYDWPLACIIGGAILMTLTAIGAMRNA